MLTALPQGAHAPLLGARVSPPFPVTSRRGLQADLTGGPHSALDPGPLFLGQVTLRPSLGCFQTKDTTCCSGGQ